MHIKPIWSAACNSLSPLQTSMNVLLIMAAVITSVSTAKAPLSASAMKAMSYRPVGRLALKQVLQNNWGAKIRCRGVDHANTFITDPCSTAGCAQSCTVTEGGPVCSCNSGYVLDSNGKSCSGELK